MLEAKSSLRDHLDPRPRDVSELRERMLAWVAVRFAGEPYKVERIGDHFNWLQLTTPELQPGTLFVGETILETALSMLQARGLTVREALELLPERERGSVLLSDDHDVAAPPKPRPGSAEA